jgi:fructoselysine-6-P-deglycase FrlB-like protein
LDTIDAFEQDIQLQVEFLKKVKLQRTLSAQLQKKSVFCGTGDSFASALLAEVFSDYRARAVDPHDLAKNKSLQEKQAYFVSISGNTISNVRAARLVKNTVAITRNRASRLAMACRHVIHLDYVDSGVLTCGSIGFVASMLACISLVKKIKLKNTGRLFAAAKAQSKIALKNKVYVLGSQYTYPLAMYAAAKMYEALGTDAHYERTEQFSHMGLFSAKKGDTVMIYEEKNPYTKQLHSNLKRLGLHVYNPSIVSKSKIDQVLFYAFVSQLVALNNAKRRGLSECHFVTSKKIRNASSDMIY